MIPLAQTATAIIEHSGDFEALREQVIQALCAGAVIVIGAITATIKLWLQKKLASRLAEVNIEGVERSAKTVSGTLKTFLGENGIKMLEKAGYNVDGLRDQIINATKRSIKAVSVEAGTEPSLAAMVAKVTTTPKIAEEVKRATSNKIVAIDANGDPLK